MSSFRKRHVQKPAPGTRTSPQTGQLITSSGNPSLDVILGGGLPIGSICLIEEDKYVTYSKVLAKYFLAEGIVSSQSMFFGSLDDEPYELLRKLPRPLNDDEVEADAAIDQENGEAPKNGLRIAWRYNDLPPVNSEQTPSKIGHHFNLLEQMDSCYLNYVDGVLWNGKRQRLVDEGEDDDDEDEDGDEEQGYYGAESDAHSKDDTDQNTTSSSSGSNTSTRDVEMEPAAAVTAEFSVTPMEVTSTTTAGAVDDADSAMEVTSGSDSNGSGGGNEAQSAANTTPETQKLNFSSGSSSDELKGILPPNMPPPPPPPMVPAKLKIFKNGKYLSLLNELQPLAREDRFTTGALVQRSLCRICITSLGSPLWYDEQFSKDILKFLTVLRATVRNSVSVCFITMPMHLVAKCDETLVPKIRNLVDYAIELESFAGSERETNPIFKEYNGLLHLRKITAVNTLTAYMPETSDLAFKLRRKKFVIEKLHLPPELQEDDANEGDKPTMSCQSSGVAAGKTVLDF